MGDEFDDLEERLEELGICAYRQRAGQLVLSRQPGVVWPDRGNSFWICRLGEDWYVCTWSPYYYRVPASVGVLDVADAFVDVGDSAQYRVPDELVDRFGLVETVHSEFDRLWDAAQAAE